MSESRQVHLSMVTMVCIGMLIGVMINIANALSTIANRLSDLASAVRELKPPAVAAPLEPGR